MIYGVRPEPEKKYNRREQNMPTKKKAEEVKKPVAKAKAAAQKVAADVKAEAAKVEKKVAAKKPAAKNEVIIQSPMGGEITPAEILAKVGSVDQVYVRVDQNKLYWVKGKESGSVEIWD